MKRVKLRGFAIVAIVFAVISLMAGSGTSTISQIPRTQTSSETKAAETKAAAESKQGVDPDLKEFLDSYEAFVDEYVVFMQQYSKNPTDLSLLARYTDIMQKYSDFAVKVEKYDTKEMSTEDAAYYLEVTSRCSRKMLKVLDSGSK